MGIDPGLSNLGWAIIEDKDPPNLIDFGLIKTEKELNEEERLLKVYNSLKNIYKNYYPTYTVIENIYFKKNIKTAIKIGEVKGVILLIAGEFKSKVYELNPSNVKLYFTGFGGSKKNNMKKMVKILYNIEIKEDDTVDAIALATSFINLKSLREKSDLIS
ncbi:MAG: crossover junction endodeoxyribonuclease RuvC [Caldisericia bacterium]|nr:crossover junction endodeoxyribonuclease RuvC [Caldisericia bacterium]